MSGETQNLESEGSPSGSGQSGKINQYKTILTCTCVGRPAMGTGGAVGITLKDWGRIKCGKVIEIPVKHNIPFSKQTKPFLEANGWKNLKTLGFFQRLCPDCSEFVLNMRARDKSTWG